MQDIKALARGGGGWRADEGWDLVSEHRSLETFGIQKEMNVRLRQSGVKSD